MRAGNMKTLSAVILLSLSAFAADQVPEPTVVRAACGPENVKFNVGSSGQQPAPQPGAGKALVYVVEQYDRPGNELGKPTVRVGLDGEWVGANRSTSYLYLSVEPGEHHLCTDWQSVPRTIVPLHLSLAKLTAEAGQTYYFRARLIEHSLSLWTLDLEQVNDDEGRLLVATSPASDYRQKK
jgi:hypothetical protein